jgi:hypothetical protein
MVLFSLSPTNQREVKVMLNVKRLYALDTTCPICNEPDQAMVDADKYDRWVAGELIQNVWPEMTTAQREVIKTGVCETCWNEMF